MTAIPSVQYTKNDDLTLAYQVTGSGRKDLVYLLFEWPNVDRELVRPRASHASWNGWRRSRASSSRIVAAWGAPTTCRSGFHRLWKVSSTTSSS